MPKAAKAALRTEIRIKLAKTSESRGHASREYHPKDAIHVGSNRGFSVVRSGKYVGRKFDGWRADLAPYLRQFSRSDRSDLNSQKEKK